MDKAIDGIPRRGVQAFLIRCAIPRVLEKGKIPSGNEPGDVIWDAVYRAHRDVLAGRGHVGDYSKHLVPSASGKRAVNGLAASLYEIIRNTEPGALIEPRKTINTLHGEYRDVCYGVTQKLINMALKYIFILQLHGCLDRTFVDARQLDCPLDSVILNRVSKETGKFKDVKWTSLNDFGTYLAIQEEISLLSQPESRLAYDFHNWQFLAFPDGDIYGLPVDD